MIDRERMERACDEANAAMDEKRNALVGLIRALVRFDAAEKVCGEKLDAYAKMAQEKARAASESERINDEMDIAGKISIGAEKLAAARKDPTP